MTTLTRFHPYVHGWHFPNDINVVSAEPDELDWYWLHNSGMGLSGGMVDAALAYYASGVPGSRATTFPGRGTDLFNDLLQRQRDQIRRNDLGEAFIKWRGKPDLSSAGSPTKSAGAESKSEWYDWIQPWLDAWRAVPIAVVREGTAGTICLAFGYTLPEATGDVEVHVYWPDRPSFESFEIRGRETWGDALVPRILRFNLQAADSNIQATLHGVPVRGFFVLDRYEPAFVGSVRDVVIESVSHLGMESFEIDGEVNRRDRVRLDARLSTNIVPWFNVLLSRDGPPDYSQHFKDYVTGERMDPHACEARRSTLTVELNVLNRLSSHPQAIPPLHLAIELPGERPDAVFHLPQPRIDLAVFLHSPNGALGSMPMDATTDDVAIVERDVDPQPTLGSRKRIIVDIPPERTDSDARAIVVGFKHSYHMGYVRVPFSCRICPEWMVPPQQLSKIGGAQIPEELWPCYELRPGFLLSDYQADLQWECTFRAQDAASIRSQRTLVLHARCLLEFVQPFLQELSDSPDLVGGWDREGVLDTAGRDQINDLADSLDAEDRDWVRHHGTQLWTRLRKEMLGQWSSLLATPQFGARLRQLSDQCISMYHQALGGSYGEWANVWPPEACEETLLAEYRMMVMRAVLDVANEAWARPGALKGVIGQLARKRSRAASSIPRQR